MIENRKKGFSLVEIIIGATIFSLLAVAVYQSYGALFSLVSATRVKIVATDLANEQIEWIRNLAYEDVGVVNGIPNGVIPKTQNINKEGFEFVVTSTIRNEDDPFDGTVESTSVDLSPADYKTVQLDIECPSCINFPETSITTRVSPANLETASQNGSLFVRVFDANGIPVSQASVYIVNNQETPGIVIDELTNNDGVLKIVDAPPGINAYEITVTKAGYSTDRTYDLGNPSNPNPSKPHATVSIQQLTQASFIIDQLGSAQFSSVTAVCADVPSLSFLMKGGKLIGTSPDIYKYEENHTTDSFGELNVPGIEWDTYSFSIFGLTHELAGVNPLMPVEVAPGSSQNIQLILKERNPKSILVAVRDSNSGLPLTDATVTITGTSYNDSAITDRGSLSQTDWSSGSGQDLIGNPKMYYSSDGNIDAQNPVGEIVLTNVFGNYAASGNLTSSTFDTGTTSNFYQINWEPTNQPTQVGIPNLRFRIATNNDNTTWEYKGPDGTTGSYYDVSDTNIASIHNGDRFLRYRAYLNTASTTYTPNLADVSFTFTSDCIPPGQVSFSGLSSDTYTINVTKTGYADYEQEITVSDDWTYHEVMMAVQ